MRCEEPNTGEQTNHPENPAEGGVRGIPRGEVPDIGMHTPSGTRQFVVSGRGVDMTFTPEINFPRIQRIATKLAA